MSPEIMDSKRYNSKTDIWSLGCILYETMCLKLPFEGNSMTQLCQNIQTGNGAVVCKTLPYSIPLKDLCRDMLLKNSVLRPGINAILGRPVVKSRISSFLDASKKRREFSHTVLHGMQILSTPPVREQHVANGQLTEANENREVDQRKLAAAKIEVQIEKERIGRNQETERLRQMIWKAECQDSPALRMEQERANKILNGVNHDRQSMQNQKEDLLKREVQLEHQKRAKEEVKEESEVQIEPERNMRVKLVREGKEALIKENGDAMILAARQAMDRISALDKVEANRQRREAREMPIKVHKPAFDPEEQHKESVGREVALVEKSKRVLKNQDCGLADSLESSSPSRVKQVPLPTRYFGQDALVKSPQKQPEGGAEARPPAAVQAVAKTPVDSKTGDEVASVDMKAKVRDNLMRFEKERLERQAKVERKISERAKRIRERQVDLQSLSPSGKQPPSPAPALRRIIEHQKVPDRVEPITASKNAAEDILLPPMPPPQKIKTPEAPSPQPGDRSRGQGFAGSPGDKDISTLKTSSIETAAIMSEQSSSRRGSNNASRRTNLGAGEQKREDGGSQMDRHQKSAIGGGEERCDYANPKIHRDHEDSEEDHYKLGERKNVSPFIFSSDLDYEANEICQKAGEAPSNGPETEFSAEFEEELLELYAQMQEIVGQSKLEKRGRDSDLDSALGDDDDTFEDDEEETNESERLPLPI